MEQNDNQDRKNPIITEDVTWEKIWQIVPEFLSFLKRPYILAHYQKLNMLALSQLLILVMLNIVFAIFTAALIVEPYKQAMGIADNGIENLVEQAPFRLFVIAAIMAPLLEEICFRGWLRGTRRAFSTIIIIAIYAAGVGLILHFRSNDNIMHITMFLWSFLIAFDGYFWMKNIWNDMRPIIFFKQYFPIIFYASAFAFAAIHITNYEHDSSLELLPMTITQFGAGLLFGYIRLRFGLLAAIGTHGTFNGILLGSVLMFGQG